MSIVWVCVVWTQACTQSMVNCHVISEVDRNKHTNLIYTHTYTHTYTQTLHHRNTCSKLNWATLYTKVSENIMVAFCTIVITWPREHWLVHHTKGQSAEGNKFAKRQRGHLITGLLQFELLHCRTITEQMRLMLLWYHLTRFSTERTGEIPKCSASKATSSWTMMFSRQGTTAGNCKLSRW